MSQLRRKPTKIYYLCQNLELTSQKIQDKEDNSIQIQVSDFEEKLLILYRDMKMLKLIDISPIHKEEE
jgi:hypothetical protein